MLKDDSNWTVETLRADFLARIKANDLILRAEMAAIKKLVEQRFVMEERARALQAAEYERRLISLNHAHEKAVEIQHTYVTQEKYDTNVVAEKMARDVALQRVDERFSEHVKHWELRQGEWDIWRAGIHGRSGGISSVWGVILGVAGLVLTLLSIAAMIYAFQPG